MGTPPNDDSKTLFRILADGEWHNYAQVRDALGRTVAPGRALRKYQEGIDFQRRYRNDPNYDTSHDDGVRIRLGQRKCAQVAISSWRRNDAIESRGENLQKEIRVKPGFRAYGIPGFEPQAVMQDPVVEPGGSTEVPPDDSVASEGAADGGDELVEPGEPVAIAQRDPEEVRAFVRDPQNSGHWMAVERSESSQNPFEPHRALPYEAPRTTPSWDPVCPVCGLAVSDQGRHDAWHGRLDRVLEPQESFVLTRSQVADVVADVMRQELDQFQRGMQSWLMQQFLQLGALVTGPGGVVEKWTAVDQFRSEKS